MVSSSVQCELSLIQSVLGLSNKRSLLLRHVEAANTSNFRSGGPGFKPRLQTRNFTPLFYFIQVFNWVPATYCLGVTLRWTRIRPRGKQQYSYAYFMLRKPEISSSRVFLWLVCAFTNCTCTLLLKYREIVFSFSLRKFNNPEVTKTAILVTVQAFSSGARMFCSRRRMLKLEKRR